MANTNEQSLEPWTPNTLGMLNIQPDLSTISDNGNKFFRDMPESIFLEVAHNYTPSQGILVDMFLTSANIYDWQKREETSTGLTEEDQSFAKGLRELDAKEALSKILEYAKQNTTSLEDGTPSTRQESNSLSEAFSTAAGISVSQRLHLHDLLKTNDRYLTAGEVSTGRTVDCEDFAAYTTSLAREAGVKAEFYNLIGDAKHTAKYDNGESVDGYIEPHIVAIAYLEEEGVAYSLNINDKDISQIFTDENGNIYTSSHGKSYLRDEGVTVRTRMDVQYMYSQNEAYINPSIIPEGVDIDNLIRPIAQDEWGALLGAKEASAPPPQAEQATPPAPAILH